MAAAPPGAPILYPKPRAQLDYITIYWQPASGTVSSYTITCAPISYSRTVPANFNQIELHGLSTGIEYAFSIYATNIYGNGPARNFVPINVGKDPSNPFQVIASTASNTSAYIRWNYSSLYAAEAPTDHFIITAIPSTTGAAPKTADWTFSNQKDLLMPNLSTGVTYGFLVQAANDIRYSSYSTLSNYIRIQIYWYPTQLDDIQCWYDASELIYANGQTIKSWPDRAERSFLFNPSTYVYPTVRVAGLNGLNVTTFNQLAGLQLSPLLTSTNQSFFAVARQSGGANFKVFGSYTSDQYIGYFGGKKQIISLDEQPMSIGLANSDTQWDLISLVLQKDITNDFYWYGSPIETNETTNIVDSLTFNGIGNASNCEIAEVIFYNRNVITEERQVVEGYLAWKWGLYSKLPPNHPWSAFPPPVDYTTKRPPRPFTSVTATDPTPSTFTINWLGGDSLYDTPTTYTFLINGVPTIPISVTDGKAVFDNLDPGTDYTVTIIATNKFGSVTSNPITATTTPSQPVINSFTNVTVSTITVGWTGGLGATSYIYYFNGVPIIPSIDNGTTNKTATFTGLNPDTFYTIIVVAVNRVGVTPSEPSDTQLAPAIPVPQVDLNLPFSLNLSWAPCPGAQSYTYTIVPSAGVNTSLTGTTIYFSNLETDTEYTITITAINGYGQSTSIPLPVTTIPADLSTILTQTTCSSFTIIWAPLASFVYSYSLINNSISTFGTGVYTPLTISSLRPNQTYTIQVWETKSTTVIYASSLTVITYPNPTSSISVSGINTNGFTLNWKGGDQASSFVFSVDGGTTLIRTPWSPDPYLTSQSGSAVFTNLSTGATFNNIIIYSENIGGVSFSDAYPTVTLLPSACANPTPSLFSQRTFTVNWQRPLGATSIVYGGSLQPNFTNLTLGPAVYTSLSPGTVYSTTYTPYNLNGTQAGQTTSLLVKTQADKPTNFQHSAPTLSTLFLTWSGVFGAEYYKYVINNVLSPISTSESSITVSSISTNTDYNIAIISYVTGWPLGQIILSTYSNYTKFITQPAIPTGQKFSSVTMSSFELTWDPVPSTVYTILVGSTIFGPYTSPTTISSLTGNSTYTITIIATNPGGSTPSTMTITTGPVAPYNISTTYVTDHEMLITWSGADGASSITIFYGPFSTTVAEPVNQPFRLYPLSSNTTYIITLDANSPISVTRSGSISPATGPGIASGLAASNVQNAQFTLSWSGAEGASSLLFHYNNLSTLSTPAIMSPTIIRNLSANTTYIVSIDSINPIFTTSSNQISVRTGPVPAGNISTQNITDTQIEITWTGTDGASSITIYYGPFSTTVAAPVIQPYIIRPLSSNTTYIISIDATNPIFNTSSQQITSRTGPTKVTGIVASNVQNAQFTLSWSGADGASSLLFHYNNLSTLSTPAIQSPTTITNLSANTVYIVSIDAINPIFTTSSNTISVLTGPVPASNISTGNITDTTVDVYWEGTEGASSIVIHYGPDIYVFPAPVNQPVTVSSLSSNKEYIISVDAVSPIFITSSQQITTKTGPGIVSGISASNITNSQFNLAWSGAQGATSLLFHYNDLSTLSSAVIPSPTLIRNLSGNTTYIVSIDAINSIFTTSSKTISVLTGPVTPYNLVQSEITNIKFLLAWSGGDGASSYTFHWGTSSLVYNAQTISNPVLISNLSTGTTYDVFIEATSPIYNAISDHYLLSTLTIIPTTAFTSITATNITDTTLLLNWTGAIHASSFYFYYAGLTVVSSATTLVSTNNILVTGLTDSAIYSFYIQGVNLLSTTTSNTIIVQMGPAPATNLVISNITDTQLTVGWQGARGASTLMLFCGPQNVTFTPPNTSPYTFTGLSPYTSYPVRIDSITHVYTNPSQTVRTTTGPGQITNLTTRDVQNSQLTLAWSGGLGASSLQFTYGSQFIISSASVTSPLTITGLTGNTNYPITVQAINSTYTTSSLVINQITGPAPATNITITNIQDKQFQVNWLNAQGASSLTFRYNSQTLSVNTPVTSPYTISSLQPFTSYTVSIDAVNHIFTTSSMQTTITTGPGQITNLTTSNVQNSQLTLAWSGGLGASSLQFTYGSQFLISSASVTSPLTITGLTGNTNYPISVQAINSTYTTSSLVINQITGPAPATNITITGIQDQQFQVNWLNAQGASSLTFRYNSQTISVNTPVASPYTISNLTPFTIYIISIDAVNHIFTTSSMQTNATTGASKATGLSYSDVTDTSFKVYWTGGTQGASSIQFVYNSNSVTYPISQTSPVTLTNLTGNTTYATYINAVNSTYATSSNSISVLTGPVTPFNLTATNITNSLFKIGWSGGQGASSYTFRYNTQQLTYNATTVANPLTIVSLSTATGYNVYIEATNSIYNAVSQVFNVSTLAVIPPLPATNITAGSITANTFLLYWQGAENASSLTFFIGGLTPIVSSATVNSPILVTGLTQNTLYPVYINAVNILNTATSNTVNITTAPNLPNPSLVQNTLSASTFQATWTNSSGITYSYTLNGGSATNIGQNPTIPYTVTSLTQNTPYTFTLIATNSASQSSQSSFQVTTIPSPPNASTQTINQNSFIITWTPVGGITYYYKLNGGGLTNAGTSPLTISNSIVGDTYYPFVLIATGLTTSISTYLNVLTLPVPQVPSVYNNLMYGSYFLIYFTTPVGGNSYYYTTNNGGPSGYINPTNVISPLNSNTSYTLTLSTTNASGSSNASMNFRTGPRRPANLYVDNNTLQTNQFTLIWSGYDAPSNYRVYYNNTTQDTNNTNTYLICNQGLSPQTWYYGVYVVAQNQYGFSDNSDHINVLTNPSPPNPYQVLSQTNLSSLQVNWDPPGNVTYDCQFNGGPMQNDIWPPQTYYNLPAGQTFQFRLWAKNQNTNTQISPVNSTMGTAPGLATNLQYSNLSRSGTANLSWQGGTGATSAVVCYNNRFNSFSNGGQLTGLLQNMNYRLTVSTINYYGATNSAPSTLTTYPEWPNPQAFGVNVSNVLDTMMYYNINGGGNTGGGAYDGNGGDNSNLNVGYAYSINNGNTIVNDGPSNVITGLSPNTTYTIQFYMFNNAGYSLPSLVRNFTTTSLRPTVAALSIAGSSCSTLSLSWTGLQYATTIDVYLNNSLVFQNLSGSATTYLASGLTQATYYTDIFIIARNNAFAGANNYSNRINGLTPALQPIQDTTQTNDSQIRMTYIIIPNNSYTYTYTNSGGSVTGPVSLSNSPFTITGLLSNSLFTLRLYNSYNGLTAVTSTIVGTGPGQETLSVVRVAYSSFTVSWTGNVGANYYIFKYNGSVPPGDPSGQVTGTSRTINTNPNTSYSVYLSEFNAYGSSFSNTVTFTTPIAPPPKPNVNQISATDSVIQVRLNNDVGGVTYTWTRDGGATTPGNYNNYHFTFDQGITPNQTYTLTVFGTNSSGPSDTTTLTVYSGPEKPYNLNTTSVSGANITFRWAGAGATNFDVGFGNDPVTVGGGTFSYDLNSVNGPYPLSIRARKNLPNGVEGSSQSDAYSVTALLADGVYNNKIPGSYNNGCFIGQSGQYIRDFYGLAGNQINRVQYPSLKTTSFANMSNNGGPGTLNFADRQSPTCIDIDVNGGIWVVSNNGTLIYVNGFYSSGAPGRFPGASGLTVGSDGFIYIVSTNGNIYKVAPQSGRLVATRNVGTALYGVCDYDSNNVFASSGNGVFRIKRDLSDANGAYNLVSNNSLGQMTRDSNGNVYVSASTEIWKIDSNGNYGRVITGIANTGPIGIGPEGCVWFGQSGNFAQLVQAGLGFITKVSNSAGQT